MFDENEVFTESSNDELQELANIFVEEVAPRQRSKKNKQEILEINNDDEVEQDLNIVEPSPPSPPHPIEESTQQYAPEITKKKEYLTREEWIMYARGAFRLRRSVVAGALRAAGNKELYTRSEVIDALKEFGAEV